MKTLHNIHKIKLQIGDSVVVRSGKYKGKVGKVNAVHPRTNSVSVNGINIVKKHAKPSSKYPQGGIIEIVRPINVSKVGILVPGSEKAPKASRVGFMFDKDDKRQRVYKSTGKEIK